jgi:DNA-binding transcriptional MocR family regulator
MQGAAIDERRANELRRVLRRYSDALVIEDDHAADVAGVELFTLVDKRRSRWAYARSVSKSLGPDLRVAILAGDAATIARVEGRQLMGIRWVSHVLQELVAELWSERSVAKHLARAEKTYAARRSSLRLELSRRGIVSMGESGMNVWVPVDEELATLQGLRERGWAVAAGERFRLASRPAVRVTTARLEPDADRRFAADLHAVLYPMSVTATV